MTVSMDLKVNTGGATETCHNIKGKQLKFELSQFMIIIIIIVSF